MNYLQIARNSLAAEQNALAKLSQNLNQQFNQVVELILNCEGRLLLAESGNRLYW